ncbi:hypothetical protein K2173_012307 [Erythroxylum novogranatense]|uniref:Uncharacterized protein n=1 Tax=Erythroxylum novogranatense TaxID=1862640 RepID=A0AAV8SC05_9ROSI|nr:hypothetical protein K2173_012307 [Erythroxylum novogranatense]
MKIFLFLFPFLLKTASYLVSSNKGSSSSVIFLEARRSMREQAMSPLISHRNGPEKTEVCSFSDTASQKDSKKHEPLSSSKHLDDLVYHIDYHGVTTHPTPTPAPKHPKP